MDEVVLSKEFEGYPEALSYLKYKEFLKISNGAVVYQDIEYEGSDYKILGLNEILESTKERIGWGYDIKDYCIVFVEIIGSSDFLLFDLKKSKNYIIDGDVGYSVDEWEYIKGDFFSLHE